MTKGTVSRAVKRLEEQLGTELIHRNTHAVALSSSGERLYAQIAGHFRAVDQAVRALPDRQGTVAGVLRLTTTRALATVLLPEPLGHFARMYPDIDLEMTVADGPVDLVGSGIDLALRVSRRRMRDSSLVARRLGKLGFGFYAAPTYLARCGAAEVLGATSHDWIMNPIAMKKIGFPPKSRARFQCDDLQTALELAVAGLGIAYVPNFIAKEPVREGTLEPIRLSGTKPHKVEIFLLYPSSGQTPRKVTALKDFLINWVAGAPLA